MSRQSQGIPLRMGELDMTASGAELNLMDGCTATTTELNLLDGYSGTTTELSYMAGTIMSSGGGAGSGITGESNAICAHSVTKIGGLFKTEILIDLTDLQGGGTIDDIIGGSGNAANSHIGQIVAAVNGTIIAAETRCHEAPAGGDPDIEIWTAGSATLAGDYLITDESDELQMIAGGDLTAGSIDVWTAWPAADQYLYMVAGTVTDVQYSAGRFVITLWGH